MKKLLIAAAAWFAFSSCAGAAFIGIAPGGSSLYADVQGTTNLAQVDNLPANHNWKTGEACQTSILGLITTGSATVGEGARAGGITKVNRVDYKFSNLIDVYAKYCIVVVGD
ncbi:MAG: TRL domain-containing protein [Myxococcaceae bacterium]